MKAGKLLTVLLLTLATNLAMASNNKYLCTTVMTRPDGSKQSVIMKLELDPRVMATFYRNDKAFYFAFVEEDLEMKKDRYRSTLEADGNLFIPKNFKSGSKLIYRTKEAGDLVFICKIYKEDKSKE